MNSIGGRPTKNQKITYADKESYMSDRAKIAHFVRRNNVEKKCVICGKDGFILHNRENPYMISFICKDCRKDENNVKIAESKRFDIRDVVPKKGAKILKTSTDEYITKVVENYLHNTLPIREYCKKIGISTNQFHTVVKRYEELHPNQPIEDYIINHRNTVHRHRIKESKSVDM